MTGVWSTDVTHYKEWLKTCLARAERRGRRSGPLTGATDFRKKNGLGEREGVFALAAVLVPRQVLFSGWVTLDERKWFILRERRGPRACPKGRSRTK